MKEIHKIIVPIDFQQHTGRVVDYAVYIAQKLNAGLYFTHVVEDAVVYGDFTDSTSLASFEDRQAEHAERMMKKLVEENKNTCTSCEGKVSRGDVVDTIIQYAREEGGDLIVIGTHGRKGLEKMWLGSVAERVVKRAPCPTLTFNPFK